MTYRYNKNNVCPVKYSDFVVPVQNAMQPSPNFPDKFILAEGDSWFHIGGSTGVGNARNLLDEITINNKQTLLLNMALSGDTVIRISESFGSSKFKKMLKDHPWHLILLSAGGNDLIDALTEDLKYAVDGKNLSIIQKSANNGSFESYINKGDLDLLIKFVLSKYEALFKYIRTTKNKEVPIIIHTYDFPTPRDSAAKIVGFKAKGPWIHESLETKEVPEKYRVEICDYIFKCLADALLTLHAPNLPNVANVYVVKTHGTLLRADSVSGESYDWLNEIHPNEKGLAKLAKKINAEITNIFEG
jgi:lysophospholipase L1-like esterase